MVDTSTVISVFSAVLALIILIDVSVLWLTGKQVPELLGQLVLVVFATYFASGLTRQKAPTPPTPPAARAGAGTGGESEGGVTAGG